MKFSVTQWVMIVAVFALAVYDVVALVLWGSSETISAQLLTAAYHHPILPFAMGVVMGHLFWPNDLSLRYSGDLK